MVYIDDHIWDFDLEAALLELSAERREQALRYRHELGRRQCTLAYLMLKRALHEEYGITGNLRFNYGEHGKPLLADYPDIHFSLSHCREAVACVVSDRPVGIDVESIGRYREPLAAYTMSETERAAIAAAPSPEAAFTRLWTMKEALLKCSGQGIVDGLKTVLEGVDESLFTTVVDPSERYIYTVFPAVFAC
jgi:4'-phosphopantetheinyl transferase